jgi:integrase
MPRQAKSARLWWRSDRVDPQTGRLTAKGTWIILDHGKHYATGCARDEVGRAEELLAAHIGTKYRPERRLRDIEHIAIADVLAVYVDDKREGQANKAKFDERMTRLNAWWGQKALAAVTGDNCRAYAATRGTPGGARRDLEDLRAAINHHAKEGLHRGIVGVWLPPKGKPRDRWLTRSEAAKLLWYCWRARETQRRWRGPNKGKTLPTTKRPLQHVARFILLGLYTGTRAAAIAAASPYRAEGRSFVDLDRGIFYRLADGKAATNKRQPPVPLPPPLLDHMRRWQRKGIATSHFVEFNGKPIQSVTTGFRTAVTGAKLDGNVTPHTLRHTAATWLMQNGVPIWEAAGFLGMSPEMVERTYGHHHPDHLKVAALGFRPKRIVGDNVGAKVVDKT